MQVTASLGDVVAQFLVVKYLIPVRFERLSIS
jgi:hypothetical protein